MTARAWCQLQVGRTYGCTYHVLSVGPRHVELCDERGDHYAISHAEFRALVERDFLRPRATIPPQGGWVS